MAFSLFNNRVYLKKVFPNMREIGFFGKTIRYKRYSLSNKPINSRKVVFYSFTDSFACNPKYILNSMMSLDTTLDFVWITKGKPKNIEEFPESVRVVSRLNNALEELNTAKVIITNERLNYFLDRGYQKREGQFLINTWHGSLGIKVTGNDRLDISSEDRFRNDWDSKSYDLLISNGTYSTELNKRILPGCSRIVEIGLPRNDILLRPIASKFREKYKIPLHIRIALYAPTWRESKDINCFNINGNLVVQALKKRFGGEWLFCVRMHPRVKNRNRYDGAIDVSSWTDIQEIMLESDVVITDYSSCIYDFVLTRKPGFIFATDRAEYENSRGLYYPLEQTPFPVAEDQETLVQNILNFDDEYLKKVNLFLQEKGCREDGNSSEKLAKFIVNFLKKNEKDFSLLGKAREFR